MQSKFFAFMSRMKYIKRWGLMRSTVDENVAEHSLQVVWVAHALAVIENKMFFAKRLVAYNPHYEIARAAEHIAACRKISQAEFSCEFGSKGQNKIAGQTREKTCNCAD